MSGQAAQALFVVFAVWAGAVAAKAAWALRGDHVYTFSIWDGGLIRAGKVLTRTGCYWKLVAAVLMCGVCALIPAGVIPLDPGKYVVVFAALATLSADFVHIQR